MQIPVIKSALVDEEKELGNYIKKGGAKKDLSNYFLLLMFTIRK